MNTLFKTENKTLTFGGYPVTLRKMNDGDVYIHCKNVIGKYSQIKAFVNRTSITGVYPYGVRNQDKCEIKKSVLNSGYVKIACLEGSPEECNLLICECESLLT